MNFLVFTYIGPISNFLGCISLRVAMIIMGALIAICAGYNYLENKAFLIDTKIFGLINNTIYIIIESIISLLIIVDFFVTKKCYTRILYILTLALTIITLIHNFSKLLEFDSKIKECNVEDKLIQFMFFIRIGAEFFVQLLVCYICYSFKEEIKIVEKIN